MRDKSSGAVFICVPFGCESVGVQVHADAPCGFGFGGRVVGKGEGSGEPFGRGLGCPGFVCVVQVGFAVVG